MPGTPSEPIVLPDLVKKPEPPPLPKARSELISLLHRLTIDVERLSAPKDFTRTKVRADIPQYYFHFMAKTLIEDDVGQLFPDPEEALGYARRMASQFSESGILFGCSVIVVKNDEVLFEIPVSRCMH